MLITQTGSLRYVNYSEAVWFLVAEEQDVKYVVTE